MVQSYSTSLHRCHKDTQRHYFSCAARKYKMWKPANPKSKYSISQLGLNYLTTHNVQMHIMEHWLRFKRKISGSRVEFWVEKQLEKQCVRLFLYSVLSFKYLAQAAFLSQVGRIELEQKSDRRGNRETWPLPASICLKSHPPNSRCSFLFLS